MGNRRQHHGSTSATTYEVIKCDDALNQSLLRCRARCFVHKEFIESRSKKDFPDFVPSTSEISFP